MVKPWINSGWLRALLFFIFFLIVNALLYGISTVTISQWIHIGSPAMQPFQLWYSVIISATASLLSVWVFRKKVDKQSVYSLGFEYRTATHNIVTGLLAALAMLGIGTLVLVSTRHLSFTGWHLQLGQFINNLLLMIVVSVSEELVFRGYLLHNFMQSMHKWLALTTVSLLFALIHLGNPGIGALSLLEIFAGGMMLGVNYTVTRNLWFGIALHFAWNFYQGPVLGYKVSGMELPSLMEQEITGPAWLTGGPFGLEGSVIALVLNTLLILLLVQTYTRQPESSATAAVL